jgi:biopolymer transport protein ExbD
MRRAKKGFSKFMDRRTPSTFKIQITSMVDMFVILLVFLLMSYSTSPIQVTPSKDLTLAESNSMVDPIEALKLVVSKSGVFVDDKKIIDLQDGRLRNEDVDAEDTQFIRSLFTELDGHAEKSKAIAKVNETVEFDGKVLMQADRDLSYETLRKVMYTAMMAGYSDVKIAVLGQN